MAKSKTQSQKLPEKNRIGSLAQTEECLPGKHQALISNSSTAKKRLG
jgi:hypothetical protein